RQLRAPAEDPPRRAAGARQRPGAADDALARRDPRGRVPVAGDGPAHHRARAVAVERADGELRGRLRAGEVQRRVPGGAAQADRRQAGAGREHRHGRDLRRGGRGAEEGRRRGHRPDGGAAAQRRAEQGRRGEGRGRDQTGRKGEERCGEEGAGEEGQEARVTRLRRSDPSGPGYARRGSAKGPVYEDEAGNRIVDERELERIRSLVIPPAWQDVWISPDARGHIQAVGTDAAGRRQYLYHESWRIHQDRIKFDRAAQLAETLPGARRKVTMDLRQEGFGRDRILAAAFRIIDLGSLRIGSEEYLHANGSRGLT